MLFSGRSNPLKGKAQLPAAAWKSRAAAGNLTLLPTPYSLNPNLWNISPDKKNGRHFCRPYGLRGFSLRFAAFQALIWWRRSAYFASVPWSVGE